MNEEIPQNPYDNNLAFKDLMKMMRRQDIITVSFMLDKYGYESMRLESKKVDKFNLQLNNGLFRLIFRYLEFGEIIEPYPSTTDNLIKSDEEDSNAFASSILKRLLKLGMDNDYIHIIPEIVDKPNRLTILLKYPYGCIVFKVQRTEEMEAFINSFDL